MITANVALNALRRQAPAFCNTISNAQGVVAAAAAAPSPFLQPSGISFPSAGSAVSLERTVVAAISATQQRPFAGGAVLALNRFPTSTTNSLAVFSLSRSRAFVPRGFETFARPLSASPSLALPTSQQLFVAPPFSSQRNAFQQPAAAVVFPLLQRAARLLWEAACPVFAFTAAKRFLARKNLLLTDTSSFSCQQVVVYRPPSRSASIFVPRLAEVCSVLSILLLRFKALQEIRNSVPKKQQERKVLESIRAKALSLFRKAYQKRQRFDKHDRWAIEDYTGPGFGVMNRALRAGATSADEQQRIDAVLRAMSKHRLKSYEGTVYRGAKLPPAIRDTLRPGATFADPGFLSCSSDEMRAYTFRPSGDGSFTFVIESKTGVDVSKFSKHKHEAEVLFRPSTTFQIQSIDEMVITMKELV